MKKIQFVTLILALMMAVSGCLADSIFDELQEEDAPAERVVAPSYGALAGVDPDQVEAAAAGGKIVIYNDVGVSGFNRFGTYLGNMGFSAGGREEEGSRLAYEVTDGKVSFVMIYDRETKIMQLVYPEGTDYAENLFPGYTRIDFNEEISIPGLGRFTFYDLTLNDSGVNQYSGNRYTEPISSWLAFHFYNSSADTLLYDGNRDSLFQSVSVEYHNDEGVYAFPSVRHFTGGFNAENKTIYPWEKDMTVLDPLTDKDLATAFDLPDNFRASTGGTIAVKLELKTGEKYVLVARDHGINLNIVAVPPEE